MLKDWRFLLIGIGIVAAAVFCGFLFMGDSQPVYAGDGAVANHSAITPVPSGEEMQFVSTAALAEPAGHTFTATISPLIKYANPGDVITATITVKEIGNTFVTKVEIDLPSGITGVDNISAIEGSSINWDTTLNPGEIVCTAPCGGGLSKNQSLLISFDFLAPSSSTIYEFDVKAYYWYTCGGYWKKDTQAWCDPCMAVIIPTDQFYASGIDNDFTGDVVIIDGVPYPISNYSNGFIVGFNSLWCESYHVEFQTPLNVDDGKRYVWQSTDVTITKLFWCPSHYQVDDPETCIWLSPFDIGLVVVGNYSTQYYLAVDNGGHGTATGEGWYDAGSTAGFGIGPTTIDLGGGYYWQFTGWSGSGSGTSYTGTDNPGTVTMDGPITETAVWVYNAPTAGAFTGTNPALVIAVDTNGLMVRYPVTPEGALLVNVVQKSPDGLLIVEIPVGTIVLNPDGTPAYLNKDPDVLGIIAATPPAPPGSKLIRAYRMLPKGLNFKVHNITIAGVYDPKEVPSGARVVWAYYDEASGKWVDMETAGYVAGGYSMANTVASQTSHFTYFALIAK